MDSAWKFVISSLTSFTFLLTLSVAQDALYHTCVESNGNFSKNSTYESNLNSLISTFSSNITANDFGFYNISSGQSPDAANGIALCRGDVNSDTCLGCIHNATTELRNRCPNQTEAIIWYDLCMFRYTNRSIFGVMEIEPFHHLPSLNDVVWDTETFNQTMNALLDSLIVNASSGNSLGKFATGNVESIYALVHCTPDLTTIDCSSCLSQYVDVIPARCDRKQGCRVNGPSCNFRFETYSFYTITPADVPPPPTATPTPASPPPSSNPTSTEGNEHNSISGDVQLLERGGGGGKVGYDYSEENFQDENEARSHELPSIQLDILLAATNHFGGENKLGEGGFGPVYKGTLPDGKEIAVKRLSRTSGQGLLEFKNEVTLIARLQHRNLVRLLGCCLENNEKLLVYEYMPNKSLDVFLFDSNISLQLDWPKRLTIINGIARGILYLHEDSRLRIIHRDLKASNVLLDAEMNPKISDFGMARIFGGKQSEANTNRVVGTYGYMAPEYAMEGLFSVKSDVFSFGVLLLEIISAKKNNRFYLWERGESLLTFAWKLWSQGQGMELIDEHIVESCVATEVLKCIHIGLLCVQEDPADRPSMSQVIVMLASETITLPRPSEPAFSVGRFVPEQSQQPSTSDKLVFSNNEVTMSNVFPR
ncbi:hypothetical protein COLO4_31715 [Corchorus olitorius]|uniref:non-specific serine/threonine protein kinase n=1 Tax=Corchorus olitorius TaxID=93759 RepID=A0A1R3H3H8_9ROSI|nr:hypothetical protein COLO4_31715 [Corchorus olitorius]